MRFFKSKCEINKGCRYTLRINHLKIMNRILLLSVIMMFGFSSERLVKTKVSDGIMIGLPAGLIPMSEDDLTQRYPSVRAPLAAFTNVERTVDFSINTSATQWPDKDLELAKQFFKSGIFNLFDRVDMIEEGVHVVHKKKLIFFEFESRVNGNRLKEGERAPVFRYSYIQYLVERDRTLVISFNCPRDQMEQWQQTARAMMKSLKVR